MSPLSLGVLASSYVAPAGGTTVAFDSFTRDDSTSLGTTETGDFTWSEPSGDMRIASGTLRARTSGSGRCIAMFDSGVADCTITCTITASSTADYTTFGPLFRYVDTNNYLALVFQDKAVGSALLLRRLKLGGWTTLAQVSDFVTPGTSYAVRIELAGSSVKVYVDDDLKFDQTVTDFATATKHGAWAYTGDDNGASSMDDLEVTT